LRAVDALSKIRSGAATAGQKIKGAGSTVVSKPRDAGKAVAGGFKWAGGGVASQTKSAGRAVGEKTKGARGAVTVKTSGPWHAAKEKFQANPWMGIAAICGAILLVAWIAWAIYVTSTNGANAGLGVVISWPAVLMALALVAAPFVGLALLIRRLQGGEGTDPPIAGGAPGPEDETP
jgi:hypothetical protein